MNPYIFLIFWKNAGLLCAQCQPLSALLLALLLFGLPFSVSAQTTPAPQPRASGDGVTGLVINQTVTPGGHDFYLIFTEIWRVKSEAEQYTLSIVERPSKRFGNQIGIFLGQARVYSGVLPRKYDQIRPLSDKAVETTLANLITLAMENASTGQSDLGQIEF